MVTLILIFAYKVRSLSVFCFVWCILFLCTISRNVQKKKLALKIRHHFFTHRCHLVAENEISI